MATVLDLHEMPKESGVMSDIEEGQPGLITSSLASTRAVFWPTKRKLGNEAGYQRPGLGQLPSASRCAQTR